MGCTKSNSPHLSSLALGHAGQARTTWATGTYGNVPGIETDFQSWELVT